jgi:hypothetical protein
MLLLYIITLYIKFRIFKFNILYAIYSILPDNLLRLIPSGKWTVEVSKKYKTRIIAVSRVSRDYLDIFHRSKLLERYSDWKWNLDRKAKIILEDGTKIKLQNCIKYQIGDSWHEAVLNMIELTNQ